MKKVIQFLLGLVIIGLIYVVAILIHTPLSFDKQLKARNADVIVKLKDIRAAERAYKSKYQCFTNNFDSLIYFILNDSLEMERKLVDEDDSVAMAQLKKAGKKNIEKYNLAVIDTIFNPRKLTKEQVRKIAETKMPDLNAGSIEAAMSMVAGTARSMGITVEE